MSNDELYYDELTNLAERIAGGLQNRTKPLDQLNQALNQLVSTNSIKGKAADSMKAYVGEVHLTLIQTLSLALTNYQMVLGKYVKGYLEVDGNHNFKLVREDLEEHQKQLSTHRSDFTDLAAQLKAISDKAEGMVYLGGAGSSNLTNVAHKMDDMKKIANELMDKWNAYEQSEPGFNQIQDLLAQTQSLLKRTLKVPRGYGYKAGSFSGLMSKDFINALQTNASYAMDTKNQKEFKDDWQSINKDYSKDQERLAKAAAKKKAKEEGIWGLILDTAQIVVGTAMVVTGVGAPFGAVLIVGGLNSAINHASMATTGKGFNLAGMASDKVGKWYNSSIGKSLGNNGVGGFINGIAKGAGSMASGMAQLNVYDLGKGAYTLATNPNAQQQMLKGLGNYWNQLRSGNMEVYGETVFNVASLFVGGAEIKGAANVAKASEADSLLSKAGLFAKTLGRSGLNNAKNLATMPGRALDNIGDIFEGKGPNYAFAHAGGSESVLNKIGKGVDDLPKNDIQKNFNKVMSEANKTEFVPKKVVLENGEIAYESKFGELVRSPNYLDEAGQIKWPEADGFVVDKSGNPITYDANLKSGQVIDRYGESSGRFTSPVNNGDIAGYNTRGLPYPENSMTYHQYEIVKDINMKNVQEAYNNLSPEIKSDLDDAMTKYKLSLKDIASPQEGKISQVFGDGGGTQIQFSTSVNWYEELGLIKEIR